MVQVSYKIPPFHVTKGDHLKAPFISIAILRNGIMFMNRYNLLEAMIVPKQGIGKTWANYPKIEGIFRERAFLCYSLRKDHLSVFFTDCKGWICLLRGWIHISFS